MQKKVMSMCVSIDYCRGYNHAVDKINEGSIIASVADTNDYCKGWNDAIKDYLATRVC